MGEGEVVESGVQGIGLDLGVGKVDRASFNEPCLFMFFLNKTIQFKLTLITETIPQVRVHDREGGGGGVVAGLGGGGVVRVHQSLAPEPCGRRGIHKTGLHS